VCVYVKGRLFSKRKFLEETVPTLLHLNTKNMTVHVFHYPTIYTKHNSTHSNPSNTAPYLTLCACTATTFLRKLLPPSPAAGFSEIFVLIYQITWHHIPEDYNLHVHHYENLKFQIAEVCPF
jgi:hypothetical protein